jgi:spermidine synthase
MTTPDTQPQDRSSRPSADGWLRLTILALFFLSGACGLVYEVVWMRMLTLVFGATAFATSTILASFFMGLALGGVYFGRLIDRGRNPLIVYAFLEVGIGAFAFLMPLLFAGLSEIYVWIARTFPVGFFGISLVRFVFSFLILLVPATFMGGTLPVIVKFFARRRERLGWHIGQLYSINTFGAVVGTLGAGFFLILLLGVREAMYLAGTVNLLIALVVFGLNRYLPTPSAAVEKPGDDHTEDPAEGTGEAVEGEAAPSGAGALSSREARLALWAIGISGFCALALEVLWTRALVFFLDNSTHAFTTILTAFLLGIALGSIIISRVIDKRKRLLVWLGAIQVLIGIFAILAIPILNHTPPVFQTMADVEVNSLLHWKWMGMRFLDSLAVMLVPTVLMGMAFPIAAKIYARGVGKVGTALGNVYGLNTMGGVLGSILAGFAAIPLIGVHNSIILVSAINVVVGLVLFLNAPSLSFRARGISVAASVLAFGGLGTYYLASDAMVLVSYYEAVEGPEILSYQEGIGATVKVYRDIYDEKTLSVNGFPVAGTARSAQDAQKPLAHLPLLLSNVDRPKVNIVGFGAGGTSWGMMQYDVEQVDCVELVPAVIDAAGWFPEINHGVLDEPGFNLMMGDGRNYALVTEETYDIISIDATSPKMAGNGSLYSLEFYQLLRDNLSEEGILVQWIPFHLLSGREVRMITQTFLAVFPHSTLWFTPMRQHVILVGQMSETRIDFQSLSRKLQREAVQEDLGELYISQPYDILGWFLMGEESLAEYAAGARLNTDNHPYLEFTPAMAYFVSDFYRLRSLETYLERRESVLPLLTNMGDSQEEVAAVRERVQRRFEATQHSLRGDILLFLDMREEAMEEYRTALIIDPGEENWLNTVWEKRPDPR